jgi:hypothetical protein
VWIVLAYQGLAHDLEASRGRVPAAVSANLVAGGSLLDDPEVTLLLAGGADRNGTAPLALGTDPTNRTLALFSLPVISQELTDGAVVRRASLVIGAPVNHVLLMSPQDLGAIVDVIGPLSVLNPSPVEFALPEGGYLHFQAGRLALNGANAVRFMDGAGESTRADREQLILQAIVSTLLRQPTIGDLAHVARSIALVADTDFTPTDVFDLAWLRFHSDVLIRCEATSSQGNGLGVDDRRQFLHDTLAVAKANPQGCRTIHLSDSPVPLPPKQLIAAIGAAYPHLWQIGLAVLLAVALVLILAALRQPARTATVRIVNRFRGIDVNALANAGIAHLPRPQLEARPARLLLRRPNIRAFGFSGAAAGFRHTRGEVVLYLVAILVSVGITLLVLKSAA